MCWIYYISAHPHALHLALATCRYNWRRPLEVPWRLPPVGVVRRPGLFLTNLLLGTSGDQSVMPKDDDDQKCGEKRGLINCFIYICFWTSLKLDQFSYGLTLCPNLYLLGTKHSSGAWGAFQVLRSDCLSIYEKFRPRCPSWQSTCHDDSTTAPPHHLFLKVSAIHSKTGPMGQPVATNALFSVRSWKLRKTTVLIVVTVSPQPVAVFQWHSGMPSMRPEWRGWGVKGELSLKAVKAAWNHWFPCFIYALNMFSSWTAWCEVIYSFVHRKKNCTDSRVEVDYSFSPHLLWCWSIYSQCLQQALWGSFTQPQLKK